MNAPGNQATLTLLVDNQAGEGLLAEHGLSIFIEVAGRRLLFDTGQGGSLEHNAGKLRVPLEKTQILVLSHGHYDHSGGLATVIQQAPELEIYCHSAVTRERFSIRHQAPKSIGMPASAASALARLDDRRIHFVEAPISILEGVGLTGPIARMTDYEDAGGPFFLNREGSIADAIEDDLALWIQTSRGVVVVCGCCHAGLVNTLLQVRDITQRSKIHAVIGGFHLVEADDQRLVQTVLALQAFDADVLIPCHCTGERAIAALSEAFGDRVNPGRAGLALTFGGQD